MQLTTLTAMLFAAVAIAGPIALPAKDAAANIEKAVRDAEPILGERASCTTTSCGIATGCPSGCGGCIIDPYFGGGRCSNK
ncbi:hypothetical protein Q7P35_006254 [Cladosporium inversicolor]